MQERLTSVPHGVSAGKFEWEWIIHWRRPLSPCWHVSANGELSKGHRAGDFSPIPYGFLNETSVASLKHGSWVLRVRAQKYKKWKLIVLNHQPKTWQRVTLTVLFKAVPGPTQTWGQGTLTLPFNGQSGPCLVCYNSGAMGISKSIWNSTLVNVWWTEY